MITSKPVSASTESMEAVAMEEMPESYCEATKTYC